MARITVDVGHYAKYNKGVVPGYYESERMWRLGEYLIQKLRNAGFEVIPTRTDQAKDLGLSDRAKVAVKNKADILISLHSNAASNSSAKGITVYYSVNRPKDKDIAQAVGETVAQAMGTAFRAAKHRESDKRPGYDYYTIIDKAAQGKVPHVLLIEHGFHTNPDDCKLLMDDKVLERIAQAECDYLCKLFAVKPQEKPQPPKEDKPTEYPTIRKGSKGEAVKELQTILNNSIYPCGAVDGIFGSKTEAAVRLFQQHNKLTVDGIVGPKTWAALLNEKPIKVKKGTVTASVLNVRKGPGTQYDRVGQLKKGTVVEIVEQGSWHKIKFGSGSAYVSGQYIKL